MTTSKYTVPNLMRTDKIMDYYVTLKAVPSRC